LLVVIKKL